MPSEKIHIGDYRLQAAGKVQLSSAGDYFTVYATGTDALLSLRGEGSVIVGSGCSVLTLDNSSATGGSVTLQAGATGSVKFGVGLPEIGALITLEPQQIQMSVGPPGVGASVKLTPASITFQVAETTYEMTPLGIVEKTAATQRDLNAMGHKLVAAETEIGVAVQGVSYSAPMVQTSAEAVMEAKETLGTHATDAMKQEQNGMMMLS